MTRRLFLSLPVFAGASVHARPFAGWPNPAIPASDPRGIMGGWAGACCGTGPIGAWTWPTGELYRDGFESGDASRWSFVRALVARVARRMLA